MKSYLEYLPLAEHYLAINSSDSIYLSGAYGETDKELDCYPYEFTTSIRDGGSYRWNMPVDYSFTAEVGGLSFCWSLYLERGGSGASGSTKFNFDLFRQVSARLSPGMRQEFATQLTKNMALFDAQVQSSRVQYLNMVLHRDTLENVIQEILTDMSPESEEAKEMVKKWNER